MPQTQDLSMFSDLEKLEIRAAGLAHGRKMIERYRERNGETGQVAPWPYGELIGLLPVFGHRDFTEAAREAADEIACETYESHFS